MGYGSDLATHAGNRIEEVEVLNFRGAGNGSGGLSGGGTEPGTRPASTPLQAAAGRERPLVLVLEDEEHDREIYGRVLWYNGFDVAFAETVQSGLDMTHRYRPDLILLDLGLPDMSGLDFCRLFRDLPGMGDVPIVVLSGFAEARLGPTTRALGCERYIEKPASPVAVLHEVETLLGKAPLPGLGSPPRLLDGD
jgi:two-component system, cell cycle response regulator DivK